MVGGLGSCKEGGGAPGTHGTHGRRAGVLSLTRNTRAPRPLAGTCAYESTLGMPSPLPYPPPLPPLPLHAPSCIPASTGRIRVPRTQRRWWWWWKGG